jgi:hypothetical protein
MNAPVVNREEIMKKLLMPWVSSVTTCSLENLQELVSIRRSSRLTLEQIADTTKISMGYLQAIENGSLEKLPGGVYRSNYLRQYAEACRKLVSPSS